MISYIDSTSFPVIHHLLLPFILLFSGFLHQCMLHVQWVSFLHVFSSLFRNFNIYFISPFVVHLFLTPSYVFHSLLMFCVFIFGINNVFYLVIIDI
jgi:hypothetical protein